jgi:hypothetical protein
MVSKTRRADRMLKATLPIRTELLLRHVPD